MISLSLILAPVLLSSYFCPRRLDTLYSWPQLFKNRINLSGGQVVIQSLKDTPR